MPLNVQAVVQRMNRFVGDQVSGVTIAITEELRDATPKDTGFASFGYHIGLNRPASRVTHFDPPPAEDPVVIERNRSIRELLLPTQISTGSSAGGGSK